MSLLRRLLAPLALVAALIPATAAAWTHDALGTLVHSAGSGTRSAPDGAGGVFVAFSAFNAGSLSYDIYVQRLDPDGAPLWPAPGALVCAAPDAQYVEAIAPDGSGGCVVAWLDYRDSGTLGSDYYAQRVSAGGALHWPVADGVAVVSAPGNQNALRMVVDPNYAWFVWTDPRNAATGNDIYVQTLVMWSGAQNMGPGTAVCSVAGDQGAPDIVLDNYSAARIVWTDARSGNYDIYGQYLAWNGSTQWTANGAPLCSAIYAQFDPRAVLLAGGRLAVTWADFRSGDYDIYAQLVSDYSASPLWAVDGVSVCTMTGHQTSPVVTADVNGEIVVAWLDQRRSSMINDLYAQKLDQTGTSQWQWGGTPVRVSSGAASSVRIASDGLGGTLLTWNDSRVDIADVYAMRLNSGGIPLWTANGVKVGAGPGSQAGATFVPVPSGGMKITWDDYGNSPWGAKHQFVDEWGMIGANPVLASVKDVPNDQGGQVKVSWYASPLDTDPLHRNITQYVVYRSVPTALAAQLARVAPAPEDGAIAFGGRRYVRVPFAAQDYFWEELAFVTARHLAQYSYVAATEGDSIGGSNRKSAFMVMALGNYGNMWWTSNADSGYSVDNLAPAAPAPLTGQYAAGTTALHWDPNTEPDLAGYRIYRGTSPGFTPSAATLVAAVPDTGYADAASAPYIYKVTAVDSHGNESPVATLMPTGTLGVGGAARAMFAAPAPNPLRGGASSTLRFALAVGGRAKLALYDAQGRVARVLLDGELAAGEHAATLRAEGLAPGLYLARLQSPGFTATRRVMVVE